MVKDLFGNEVKINLSLRDRYIEIPVSILNTNNKNWIYRKRKWNNLGIKSEIGRDNKLLGFSVTVNKKQGGDMNKKNISVFDPVLTEIMYSWFCPLQGKILDPFAGGSVRGIVANYLGYKYTGIELRIEQVNSNRQQANEILDSNNQPIWECGDSEKILPNINNTYDFLFSCPPYSDLEVYSDHPDDLSNMKYSDFLSKYRNIIKLSCDKLNNKSYAIFVVGEIRDKKGYYRDFVGDTKRAFMDAGLKFYNEMILQNNIGSSCIRIPRIFESTKKIVKIHQYVLCFYKE